MPASRSFSTALLVAYDVQVILLAWNECMPASELNSMYVVLQVDLFYNNERVMFEIFRILENGYYVQSE